MPKRRCLIWILLGWLALPVLGAAKQSGPIDVAVSVLPHVWLVERIGGQQVEVRALVSPGESPATYQPSDSEVSRVLRSEIYFCLGMPFENGPWFEAIRQHRRVDLVDLRQGLTLLPEGRISEQQRCRYLPGQDPHVWLSPKRLAIQARTIASELGRRHPEKADLFESNLARLEGDLEELDGLIESRFATLAGKSFFVYHPVWGYLADDYFLRQVAIEDHGSAPSDREMTELRGQFMASGSRYLFVQPQVAGRAAASVARLLGAELREVDPLALDVISNLEMFTAILEESLR